MTTTTERAPRPFFNRDLFLIWQGMAESKVGSVLYSIAIGIWVYDQTASAAWMGAMTAVSYIGNMALQPLGGVLADRFPKTRLAAGSDAVCGVTMLALGALALTGHMRLWQVLAVAVVSAVCGAVLNPALNTLLPRVVEPDSLMRASALMHSTQSAIQMIGNAAGGFLVVAFGVPGIILFNGATFLFSAVTEWFIQEPPEPHTAPAARTGVLCDLAGGLRYLTDRPGLFGMMLAGAAVNLTSGGFVGVVYVWCLEKGMSIEQYGLFLGTESAAMLAALLLLTLRPVPGPWRWQTLAISTAAYCLLYTAAMVGQGFWLCTVLYAVNAFFNTVANTFLYPVCIQAVDPAYHGRVLAIFNALCTGTAGLSMVAYGVLGDAVGVSAVCLGGALLTFVPAVLFVLHPMLRRLLGGKGL